MKNFKTKYIYIYISYGSINLGLGLSKKKKSLFKSNEYFRNKMHVFVETLNSTWNRNNFYFDASWVWFYYFYSKYLQLINYRFEK